jgi:hypothetical protein
MFKAFARVAARSIAIQLEEAAAVAKSRQPYVDPVPRVHRYTKSKKLEPVVAPNRNSETIGSLEVDDTQQQELSVVQEGRNVPDKPLEANKLLESKETSGTNSNAKDEDVPAMVASSSGTYERHPQSQPAVPGTASQPAETSTRITSEAEPVEIVQEPPIEPSAVIDDVDPETVSYDRTHRAALCTDPSPARQAPVTLRPSKVPSSRLGRLFHYGCQYMGNTSMRSYTG